MISLCEFATCPEVTVPWPPIEWKQDKTFRWQGGKVLSRLEQCQHVSCMPNIHYTMIDTAFKSCMVNRKMLTYCLSVCVEFAGPCSCHCPRSYELTAPIHAAIISFFESRGCIRNPMVNISRVRSILCHWPWQTLRFCLPLTCISHLTCLCPRSLQDT